MKNKSLLKGEFLNRKTIASLAALSVVAIACSGEKSSNSSPSAAATANTGGSVDLTGAGATFPYPLYSKWFADYATATGVKINYQSIGSGGGIRQLSEGTVDFGASDSPMKDDELAKAKGPVMHFPTVLGAVAITYNVPGITSPLKLSGPVLADMLRDALQAFTNSDGTLGRDVCKADDAVDALHNSVFRILLTHMMEDARTITPSLELLLVSRNLERVADLATNIGEDAVYLAEGKQIKHHFED